jgi:hypothetical protein
MKYLLVAIIFMVGCGKKHSICDGIDTSTKSGRLNKAYCEIGECVDSGGCK